MVVSTFHTCTSSVELPSQRKSLKELIKPAFCTSHTCVGSSLMSAAAGFLQSRPRHDYSCTNPTSHCVVRLLALTFFHWAVRFRGVRVPLRDLIRSLWIELGLVNISVWPSTAIRTLGQLSSNHSQREVIQSKITQSHTIARSRRNAHSLVPANSDVFA